MTRALIIIAIIIAGVINADRFSQSNIVGMLTIIALAIVCSAWAIIDKLDCIQEQLVELDNHSNGEKITASASPSETP